MSNSPGFAENTQRILDEGIECGNDFASLVASGEALRGYSMMKDLDVIPPELATYDAFLLEYKGEVHDDVEQMMAECMSELYAYANQSRRTREWEDGTWLLDDINAILATAAALVRAGRIELPRLKALSDRTCQALSAIACKLGDLCQYAEDHTLIYMSDNMYGEDVELFDVYTFWEYLAHMSESRIAICLALHRNARRQRIIDEAVARYAENGPQ